MSIKYCIPLRELSHKLSFAPAFPEDWPKSISELKNIPRKNIDFQGIPQILGEMHVRRILERASEDIREITTDMILPRHQIYQFQFKEGKQTGYEIRETGKTRSQFDLFFTIEHYPIVGEVKLGNNRNRKRWKKNTDQMKLAERRISVLQKLFGKGKVGFMLFVPKEQRNSRIDLQRKFSEEGGYYIPLSYTRKEFLSEAESALETYAPSLYLRYQLAKEKRKSRKK